MLYSERRTINLGIFYIKVNKHDTVRPRLQDFCPSHRDKNWRSDDEHCKVGTKV